MSELYKDVGLAAICPTMPYMKPLRERLEERLRGAEELVKELKNALELLDKNKGFEETHNAISRVGF